eukprot:TRINITY_DN5200_c0_g3_i2.p2 TRINITY_DN5200_c0_g3~~TRINITY_DN5200_c0_g3_i2.p2  ORF type:complete len:199 (-),score=32.94 TRINITY_DN5200_c0_g3_i2:414-1010(-)
MTNQKYELMLNMLTAGEIEIFAGLFEEFVINNLSYFDVAGKEPEKVYHAFVLGMLISLSENYEVKSNKESGYGRYDVMIIPKDTSKVGIIMEFKKIDDFLKTTIDEGTALALKQIEDMKYEMELIQKELKILQSQLLCLRGKRLGLLKNKELIQDTGLGTIKLAVLDLLFIFMCLMPKYEQQQQQYGNNSYSQQKQGT